MSADELAWLGVQRRWRAEREFASREAVHGLSAFEAPAVDTSRFAALAVRPYGELSDDERSWLVAASSERSARGIEGASSEGKYLAVGLLLGVVGGFLLGAWAMSSVSSHIGW